MFALFWLIDTLLGLVKLAVFVGVILSWLVAFNVINAYQPFVRSVLSFLDAVTEPLLRPFRQIVPSLGGMDISPILLLLAIHFLQILIRTSVAPIFGVYGY
ncbi:YggT family protein [Eilatimonas milleporae]|uniref:YggT family protein n=1 Tax=Eilatimonas milleporae TaxID=911205 RepID=A0A3M0BWQ8_9PROT|nr:YggT family protein [Eilatimonas milleporae]RMB02024.1 YggT family protein [Eilatimonas milleporae]